MPATLRSSSGVSAAQAAIAITTKKLIDENRPSRPVATVARPSKPWVREQARPAISQTNSASPAAPHHSTVAASTNSSARSAPNVKMRRPCSASMPGTSRSGSIAADTSIVPSTPSHSTQPLKRVIGKRSSQMRITAS